MECFKTNLILFLNLCTLSHKDFECVSCLNQVLFIFSSVPEPNLHPVWAAPMAVTAYVSHIIPSSAAKKHFSVEEGHKSPQRVNFKPLGCWISWMLAEIRHKIKSLHLGTAQMVEAVPSLLQLSLLQVWFSLGHTDYLRELVLSDLGWQSSVLSSGPSAGLPSVRHSPSLSARNPPLLQGKAQHSRVVFPSWGKVDTFLCQSRYTAASSLLILFVCTCSVGPCECHSETAIESTYKPKYAK